MAKFSEETFNSWRMPPSTTEENKLQNAEKLVREAIAEDTTLNNFSITIFGQGSYANDTNVRLNSDIDINVRLSDTIFVDLPKNKTYEDLGYSDSPYTFTEYKMAVFDALVNKFGSREVVWNNKCLTVKYSPTRVETDVVPTLKLIRHDDNGSKHIGVRFISDEKQPITGYPLQHIENAKVKNAGTQKRYKRLTRIFRRIRYRMIDDNISVSNNITSFLLECLLWNVPNNIFNGYDTWMERARQAIIFLYQNTTEDANCKDWGEVSELLYLFVGRKWSRDDVNTFLVQMWNYIEFK
jgi:hypothetical protein